MSRDNPQAEFDEHMSEIYWTNVALMAGIARHQQWLASIRQVWRDNRHHERDRLPDSGSVNDGAFMKFTAQEIAAVLGSNQ